MKTALEQYISDLKTGNCKGEEYYIELERNQIIDAHVSGFCDKITPEYYYEQKYLTKKK